MRLAWAAGFLVVVTPLQAVAQVSNGSMNGDTLGVMTADSPAVVQYEIDPFAAVVPWGPGERLEYRVKLGVFNAGEAYMDVIGIDSIRGEPSYHIQMALRGSLLFGAAKLDDHWDSWVDTRLMLTRRYIRDLKEPGYTTYRYYEFYPEELYWERTDNDESGDLATALPLDDIAFIYYVRTLPLEVGKTYTVPRYFKKEGNPVIIHVEGKDVRETDAGTFNTIVVRPTIQTSGIFSEGGEAELHFTDDENRHLVYMRIKMPVVGSVTLHLRSITQGTPIHPGASGY
jgi:hypothetical protein